MPGKSLRPGGLSLGGLVFASSLGFCVHAAQPPGQSATAILAGGCFWCMESDFEKLAGVLSVESGYTAGQLADPSYQAVSAGGTGHTEAVRIVYDPAKVSYPQLLDHFWRNIDPTVKDRQFCDIGSQYRSGIYWQTDSERQAAETSRDVLLKSGKVKEIRTEIQRAGPFYPAEQYHQDYYRKNPVRYAYYRHGCGRDARLKELWGR
ncbi:MAG: peptide-methionine (S)-S-oxide reductase MsrA [Betaproteobacteria bacterium]|nr:peptide-methionine (S)-S-oxide reductase MsrA [Betaproteobacteria bacterium]